MKKNESQHSECRFSFLFFFFGCCRVKLFKLDAAKKRRRRIIQSELFEKWFNSDGWTLMGNRTANQAISW